MKFTGERYLPEIQGTIYLEHYHRYYSIFHLVKDKRVLDIACGEGYGSHLLASHAKEVIGVDISAETIDFAKNKYKQAHLRFEQGSTSAIPIEDHSIDVVVSFETIEHHDQHEQMMKEVKRVLAPGGLLIISSPDKHNYNKTLAKQNEFHVKELEFFEFKALIRKHFAHSRFFYQKLVYGSLLCSEDDTSFRFISDKNQPSVYDAFQPIYDLAICSDAPFLGEVSSFFDGSKVSQKLIESKQNEIHAMQNSITWKVGRFFLTPFSVFKKFARRGN
ncbi:MAG: class I SAM-dependent methyltransferase [Flavobacteriales bacterium]|nr:class I SAM-dependent methyltransferase [Flavobacteriales bacterium]